MGKSFWDKLQLWEKMCLILGIAILTVIFFGICKLIYSRWQLRKYTAVAEAKAAQLHGMSDIGRSPRSRRKAKANEYDDDIPFGIRAIERGVNVDGVWVSRSNTPTQSVSGSPASESESLNYMRPNPPKTAGSPDRTSSISNMSHLEMPQPVHGYPGGSNTSTRSSDISDAPFERGLPTEEFQTRPISYQSESARFSRTRPTYQPRHSSHLRFSNSQGYDYEHEHEHGNSAAMAALEGRSAGAVPKHDDPSRSSS